MIDILPSLKGAPAICLLSLIALRMAGTAWATETDIAKAAQISRNTAAAGLRVLGAAQIVIRQGQGWSLATHALPGFAQFLSTSPDTTTTIDYIDTNSSSIVVLNEAPKPQRSNPPKNAQKLRVPHSQIAQKLRALGVDDRAIPALSQKLSTVLSTDQALKMLDHQVGILRKRYPETYTPALLVHVLKSSDPASLLPPQPTNRLDYFHGLAARIQQRRKE